ncbi:serine/threonine protein kinase [Buttiauxella warmboldiae]|uniref:Serine/threonine protein kinase n=1 Tax=Buttiauxella warmboldiae TaxID=82993 RepID=A0A3N5DSL4_9ENTR|nr:serine/threonine-protein kinase [Buttiauxella warmboldiae]RPH30111.1 serine/threonine protein kinase [Buttiauxella warmboldiae]
MTDKDYPQEFPDALPPGFRFDEFEIQQVAESNHTSVVYQAWDHQLERPVTIHEFMPRALAVRSDNMQLVLRSKQDSQAFRTGINRFLRSARQLAQFNHPNLLQVLSFWTQNETAYVATRYASGMTLAELQQQPEIVTEAWIRRMLPMLCSALATLHDEGFIHRDLSLRTVQIQDNGAPLLLSAGAPRRTDSEKADEIKTALNPGFAALEQYADDLENQLGPWTDIYALGAMLYTLITGTCPPASVTRTLQDPCVKLAKNRPEGYSHSLLQAVDQALALKPEERPQSVAEFAALADISLSGSTPLRQPGTMLVALEDAEVTPRSAFRKRYKLPLLTGISLLVGMAIGAVIFGGRFSASPPSETTKAQQGTTGEKAEPSTAKSVVPASDEAMARIYVRMNDDETLAVNGKTVKVTPGINGYGFLQLTVGKYEITLNNSNQTRSMTLTVEKAGTWLINPPG